ncbi:MAG: aminopeptidase P family protein [SAR202 cluster bacterium]|nr:aminopeptidase P family protein [SAR202 cluster bacterium]
MNNRLRRLRQVMAEKDLDAFLVSTPENRRYVSGFTGSAGYLLVTQAQALLATDFRYIEQATGQSPDFQVIRVGRNWNWFLEQSQAMAFNKVGFEGQNVTVSSYNALIEALQASDQANKPSLIATSGVIETLRAVKEPGELMLLQRAIDISDKALKVIVPTIKPGETEREIAWRLEKAMREFGADAPSFDTIVAAGPNGAMPHHRPSDRPVQAGEPVVIDMGARLNGYCSDITRTICVGEPDEMFRKIYDYVLGAQLTAIATIKPGMTGGEGDGMARQVIDKAGHGETFGHSLGHGIGLAVHESPWVGPNAANVLEENMVFSVEPGIYITGWGGVRIEDLVALESSGARVLSKARK